MSAATSNVEMPVQTQPMSAAGAEKLLELLGSDDLFRQLFITDPEAALKRAGGEVWATAQSSRWCFEGICKLASKEEIQAARDEIRGMLLRGLDQTVPRLDTGAREPRHLRR